MKNIETVGWYEPVNWDGGLLVDTAIIAYKTLEM